MRFEVSERIKTSKNEEAVRAFLKEQLRKVATKVTEESGTLVAKRIEDTFGSINRSDTSTFRVQEKKDGHLIVADVHYRPSLMFWVIFILLIFTYVAWVIPVGFYLYQRKTARSAIDDVFKRTRNEQED